MVVNCFLSPRRLRLVLSLASFGTILVWVLLGRYSDDAVGRTTALESARSWDGARPATQSRHLLSAVSLVNFSNGEDADRIDIQYDPATIYCEEIHNLAPNVSKCDFVRTVTSCQEEEGLLSYLQFIYCSVPPQLIPLSMVILFLWLIVLFIFLGTTSESFFCPALIVMSRVLHLSQNVAGVTLLALGNGAPDIFSSYAAIDQNDDRDASLAFGALFGGGLFVTTIVIALVAVLKPVDRLSKLSLMRDIVFYLAAAFWTFNLLWKSKTNIWNAIGYISLYSTYVTVVILGQVILKKIVKKKKKEKISRTQNGSTVSKPKTDADANLSQTVETSFILESGRSTPHLAATTLDHNGTEDVRAKRRPRTPAKNFQELSISDFEVDSESESVIRGRLTPRRHSRLRVTSPLNHPPSHQISTVEEEQYDADASDDEEQREKVMSGDEEKLTRNDQLHMANGGGVGVSEAQLRLSPTYQKSDLWKYETPRESPKIAEKTVAGALDLTEEIGAAVGIPHVAQVWEEIHRSHSRSQSRCRSCNAPHTPQLVPDKEEIVSSTTSATKTDESDTLLNKPAKRQHPFVKMLCGIWPIAHSFRDFGYIAKVAGIVKTPFLILLALTVPIVDIDEKDHNWNKWLNVFHVVSGPVFIALITKQGLVLIGGVFPVVMIVLVIATFVAIAVACTSRNDKPPRYHCVFAWLAFAVAVVWIYSIANEIVNVLDAFGLTVKLSNGILGLTLLAWGNSIPDTVADTTMARQGFPEMAIGACFGGPLLNMLLGIGIASLVKSIRRKSEGLQFAVYMTQVEFLAFIFLAGSLVSSLVAIVVLKVRLRWPYGVCLLVLYCLAVVFFISAEFNVFTIPGIDIVDNV